jgi:hypothetical protein
MPTSRAQAAPQGTQAARPQEAPPLRQQVTSTLQHTPASRRTRLQGGIMPLTTLVPAPLRLRTPRRLCPQQGPRPGE